MRKSELIKIVAKDADITQKDAAVAVESVFSNIKQVLINNEIFTIERFITLKPVIRAARAGFSPATGEKMQIPERRSVKISLSPKFKAELNPTQEIKTKKK